MSPIHASNNRKETAMPDSSSLILSFVVGVSITLFVFVIGFCVFAGPAMLRDIKRAINEAKENSHE